MELYNNISIPDAWETSSARSGYPKITQEVSIVCEIYPTRRDDGSPFYFVRLGAIPEHLHGVINELSTNSTCPAPDDKRDALYQHDVSRWLRSVGVNALFVEPPPI